MTEHKGRAQPGNELALRSGFYAMAEIDRNPRTAAIADWIEAQLDGDHLRAPGDAITVWLLAGCIERRIRGLEALAEPDRSAHETRVLRRDLSTVENTIARLLKDLGFTPTSYAALGVDRVRVGDLSEERLKAATAARRRAEARLDGEGE